MTNQISRLAGFMALAISLSLLGSCGQPSENGQTARSFDPDSEFDFQISAQAGAVQTFIKKKGRPPKTTNSLTAKFSFSCNALICTYDCRVDGSAWKRCTSPKVYNNLSPSAHTFKVRATNFLGQADLTPAKYKWTIDVTPPDTMITSNPADPTNDTNAHFAFSADESGSTFECNLDSGGWSACASPENYSGLAEGGHNFQVRATDGAGNVDPAPAVYAWTIDTTPPETSITSQPSNPSDSPDASFGFDCAPGPCTFECKLDSGGWSPCSSPKNYNGLQAGNHTFQVRATDQAGNIDPTPASYNWTIGGCGGGIICKCGDTVYADYILPADLNCPDFGLIVGANGITIDGVGHTIAGNGGGRGILNVGFDHVSIKNLRILNFFWGIYFNNSSGSIIENNYITSDYAYDISSIATIGIALFNSPGTSLTGNEFNLICYGIRLQACPNSNLTGNIASKTWAAGIALVDSSESVLINNTAKSNYGYGMRFINSPSTLENNSFSYNSIDIEPDRGNINLNNQFNHNINSVMLDFTQLSPPRRNLNDGVTVNFAMKDTLGNNCPQCGYILSVYPGETINSSKNGNNVSVNFNVRRPGIYTLRIQSSDTIDNTAIRDLKYFVNATGSNITKYYFRGIDPTHGQPKGKDTKSLLLQVGDTTEFWKCGGWVQNSPDELPPYPISVVDDININAWYKMDSGGKIAIQKIGTTDNSGYDRSHNITASQDYTYISDIDFSDLKWNMDYIYSWYYLTFKLIADANMTGNPYMRALIGDTASYTNVTQFYTTTPAIKYLSNSEIFLLSANPSDTNPNLATLVLEGIGSNNITLDNYNYPFPGHITTINSQGTATLQITGLNGEASFSSVNMAIFPDQGSLDVNVISFQSGGNYYKEWTETGSSDNINVNHIIGDLAPDTSYAVLIDDQVFATLLSNSSGEINFISNLGSATQNFKIVDAQTLGPL